MRGMTSWSDGPNNPDELVYKGLQTTCQGAEDFLWNSPNHCVVSVQGGCSTHSNATQNVMEQDEEGMKKTVVDDM